MIECPPPMAPSNPTWEHAGSLLSPSGTTVHIYDRGHLRVLSECSPMLAPDDSDDVLPTWLVSVSRAVSPTMRRKLEKVYGRVPGRLLVSTPTDEDLNRVRHDFGMVEAEEDNHEAHGRARKLFLVVDPERRVECECKATERVYVRPDGYRYSVEETQEETHER